MNTKSLFKEVQSFSSNWLAYVIMLPLVIFVYGCYKQLFMGESFGSKPLPDMALIGITIVLLILSFFVLSIKLVTNISKNGINISFFPFFKRYVSMDEINNLEVLDYGFVGGWGIRLFTKHGTIYNIKGSKGLKIECKSGKSFIVGTQRENELAEAIKILGQT